MKRRNKFVRQARLPKSAYDQKPLSEVLISYMSKDKKEEVKRIIEKKEQHYGE